MDSTLSDSLVGRLLDGRYRVESRVARGGMATVYTALDTRLERIVALKVMHPVFADDEEFVARFIREAKSAARLSHPNVVAVFDQGEDAGHVFLAMEYIEGRTLRDLIRERGRLSAQEALSIMAPVLSALAAAHAAGLIHRDVKPENVLLADDGRVKVADFGLARAMAGRQTTTSTLIGTVAYLAPEQITRGVADARTDVYSAGIVLFEMLTGQPPYDADTPISVAYRHAHEDVPRPSSVTAGVPAAVDSLVERATARDPDHRPSDAAAFLAELQRVRRSLPALEADGERPTAFTPRGHETLVVERSADPATPWGAPPVDPPADLDGYDDEPPQRRARRGLIAFLVILLLAAALGGAGWWYGTHRSTSHPSANSSSSGPGAAAPTTPAAVTTVAVPDITSTATAPITSQQALATLNTAGLKMVITPATVASPGYSSTVPKGDILSQSPTPTEGAVNKGSTVTVTLSAGVQTTTVPDFDPAGSTTLSSYEAQLTGSQLVPGAQLSEAYSDAPVGNVINVVPTPYSTLDVNSPVAITVSAGIAPLPVPAVTGKTLSVATQLLKASGFLILEKQDFSNTVPSGSVIAQDPYAGVNGKVGDTVTVDVSKGPQLFEIPNVVSPSVLHVVTVSSATKTLEKDGFVVKVNRGDLLVAIVSGQSPKAGTLAPAGTVVTINTP